MTPDWQHPSDETLATFTHGELRGAAHGAVERHLAACASCAGREAQLKGAFERFVRAGRANDDAPTVVSDEFRSRVHSSVRRLAREEQAPWPRRVVARAGLIRPRLAIASIAAAAALALLAALFPWSWSERFVRDEIQLAVQLGVLPVPSLTPGATRPVPLAELCAGGAVTEREVSSEVRQAVLRDYRMEGVPTHEYELDYLITPELGGSDDRLNLWPERYSARVWNASVKDELERLLPQLVCRGEVDLETAQRDIAANWIAAYKKYFHSDRPIGARTGARLRDAAPAFRVFVLSWRLVHE